MSEFCSAKIKGIYEQVANRISKFYYKLLFFFIKIYINALGIYLLFILWEKSLYSIVKLNVWIIIISKYILYILIILDSSGNVTPYFKGKIIDNSKGKYKFHWPVNPLLREKTLLLNPHYDTSYEKWFYYLISC